MGKGDKRSFKGKIFKGSFGNSRPRRSKKNTSSYTAKAETATAPAVAEAQDTALASTQAAVKATKPKSPVKKAKVKKEE